MLHAPLCAMTTLRNDHPLGQMALLVTLLTTVLPNGHPLVKRFFFTLNTVQQPSCAQTVKLYRSLHKAGWVANHDMGICMAAPVGARTVQA